MRGKVPELQGGLVLRKCDPERARKIDLLLLSIGGNDIGCARLVANAVLSDGSVLRKSSQFSQLHDKKGYKFFCFSNIFSPSGSNDNTGIRYIIISSPNRDFVRYVSMMLIKIKERKDRVSIGNMQLMIDDVRIFETKLKPPFTLITVAHQ
jgi:CRISPR/Cas system endoribonuclease Cas6 (RAMP superfamily)